MRAACHRPAVVLLTVVVLVAGCSSSNPSPSPAASASVPLAPTAATQAPTPATTTTPGPLPTATLAPSQRPIDPFLGQIVVTVSDGLRVRSEPRVSDDSIKYEPLLPLGTELTVIDGPVSASGYTWYKVAPVSFAGLEGPGDGWVARAGKDGEQWIALAERPIAGIEIAKATVTRAPADPEKATTVAASITAFGLDLYRAMLADPELNLTTKNAVFSPTSIALALGMTRAGARGETATELDAALHTTGWEALGSGLNALDQALASRNATSRDGEGTAELALRIANVSFAQRGWSIEQTYLDAIASAFGAGVRLVDYAADPGAARAAINAWASEQTKKRIPELLRPRDVTTRTRLALVNAIYLKAEWEARFQEGGTKPGPFTRLDGSRVDVPMMQTLSLGLGPVIPYARGNGWQATELRYKSPDNEKPLAMTIILPDDLPAFEARLSAAQLTRITTALTAQREDITFVPCPDYPTWTCYPYRVLLFMPRFGFDTRVDLPRALTALGVHDAFDPGRADLTGIHVPETETDRLYLSKVIHQANIDVDEKGTEAAAATAVIGDTAGGGAAAAKTITLRLDRPFLFILRDVETGAVLFMGRVVDPPANA